MTKLSSVIFVLLSVLALLVLIARSVLHSSRIYMEFSTPRENKLTKIDVCSSLKDLTSLENERFYNYLQIGAVCEKH